MTSRGLLPPALLLCLALPNTAAEAQESRSIFSMLDTQGRSVAVPGSIEGALSIDDPLSDGGRRVQVWTLQASPGSGVQLDLRSDDFDAFLYVVGPGLGDGLRDDDGGNGLNSRLCVAVSQPGEYRVVASSLDATVGDFVLEAMERPGSDDGVCPDGPGGASTGEVDLATMSTGDRLLRAGDDVEGVLSSTDPVVFGSPGQAWAMEGQAGATLSIDLVSQDFDAYLLVAGPGLEDWLSDDDGAGRCDSRVTLTFPQDGTYRVIASTLGSTGGQFRLLATQQPRARDPEACVPPAETVAEELTSLDDVEVVGSLTPGFVQTGTMTGNEGEYSGRPLQGWTVEGSAGALMAIEMTSDFDTYLYLAGPGFDEPVEDDDSAGDFNSRICVELPESATYRVYGGPFSGAQPGGTYTLSATLTDAEELCESFVQSPAIVGGALQSLPTEGRVVALGTEVQGMLGPADPRHPETDQTVQPWSFEGVAGERVFVDVESEDFDALIYAVGTGVPDVQFVDDAGAGCNARLMLTPTESGTIILLPGGYYAESVGTFRLRVSTDPPALTAGACNAGPITATAGSAIDGSVIAGISSGTNRRLEMGSEVQGTLTSSDETRPSGEPAQAWTVSVRAGEEILLELLSDDFDAILYVDGPGLATPLVDDDGAGNLNSRIIFVPPQNAVLRVVASALAIDAEGSFQLRALRRR